MPKKEITLQEGDKAPEFNLSDSDGKRRSLKDFKGKKSVVLYFYPKDMTPGCTQEACDFTEHLKAFEKKGAEVIGVSFDDEERHRKFIEKYGLKHLLLSDTDKKVANAYGVYQEKSLYGRKFMGIVRSTFVIDPQGKIKKVYPKVKVDGHWQEVLESLG